MSDCPFCARIAAGEYDDDLRRFDAVSFEPLNPVTEGHRLVVPKTHVRSALGHVAIAADVMAAAVLVALQRGITECNFITSAGPATSQTVEHFHLHVVPRHEGDGLALPWTGQAQIEPEPIDMGYLSLPAELQEALESGFWREP